MNHYEIDHNDTKQLFVLSIIIQEARKTFNQNAMIALTRPFNVDIIRQIKIQDWPINGYVHVIATYNSVRHRHDIFPRQNKHNGTFRSDTMSPLWETNLRRSSRGFETPFVRSAFVFSCNPILHFSSLLSRTSSSPQLLFLFLSANVAGNSTAATSAFLPRVTYQRRPYDRSRSVIVRWRRRRQCHVGTRYPENIGNLSGLLCHPTSACSICFFCFYLRMDERASEIVNFGSITPSDAVPLSFDSYILPVALAEP